MKIKRIAWTTFLISTKEVSLITDPLKLQESGIMFPKTVADISVFTDVDKESKKGILKDNGLEKKVVTEERDSVMEIYIPGEYEVGGMMIRRSIGTNFYLIDESTVRVAYLGGIDNSFDVEKTKDLGDVDVLIVPVGNGEHFLSFDKLEKVLSYVDPAILLPCAYKEDGGEIYDDLKSKEEFIKHFGFTNVSDENYINIKPTSKEADQKGLQVVFL